MGDFKALRLSIQNSAALFFRTGASALGAFEIVDAEMPGSSLDPGPIPILSMSTLWHVAGMPFVS